MRILTRLLRNEEAATAVEYAVMLALILMAIISAIGIVGQTTGGIWNNSVNQMQSAGFVP